MPHTSEHGEQSAAERGEEQGDWADRGLDAGKVAIVDDDPQRQRRGQDSERCPDDGGGERDDGDLGGDQAGDLTRGGAAEKEAGDGRTA